MARYLGRSSIRIPLVCSIVVLDRNAAKAVFVTFLSEFPPMNANQIFLNEIVGYFVRNGIMELK